MKLAMIGLGRMGGNMARRLLRGGVKLAVYNRTFDAAAALRKEGAYAARSLAELVSSLETPRTVWLMLPAGAPTQDTIEALVPLLSKGDLIVDGGNANWQISRANWRSLEEKGLLFCDAGVSGGIWGLRNGYCIMAGGEKKAYARIEPYLKKLCGKGAYLHCGPAGAGHYVKMVHNGIEYAMMQAYGEGFALLKASPYGGLDKAAVADLWNHGSVVRSWLLELAADAFRKDPDLKKIRGYVEDSGEGRWTVDEAVRLAVPAPAITAALFKRFSSRVKDDFSDRLLAAMRNEFGGHAVKSR